MEAAPSSLVRQLADSPPSKILFAILFFARAEFFSSPPAPTCAPPKASARRRRGLPIFSADNFFSLPYPLCGKG